MASTECNGEIQSVSSSKENTSSSCESSGSDSEGELLQKAKDTATTARDKTNSSHLSRLFRCVTLMWLLLGYLATSMACSLITPFYPEQVALAIAREIYNLPDIAIITGWRERCFFCNCWPNTCLYSTNNCCLLSINWLSGE